MCYKLLVLIPGCGKTPHFCAEKGVGMSKKILSLSPKGNCSMGLFVSGAILGAAGAAYVGIKAAQFLSKIRAGSPSSKVKSKKNLD
jgi:hypothetical protein